MRIGEYAELKNLNDSDMYIVDTDSGTYKVKGSTLKEFIGGGIEVPEPDLSEIESAVKANTSSIAAFETRMGDVEKFNPNGYGFNGGFIDPLDMLANNIEAITPFSYQFPQMKKIGGINLDTSATSQDIVIYTLTPDDLIIGNAKPTRLGTNPWLIHQGIIIVSLAGPGAIVGFRYYMVNTTPKANDKFLDTDIFRNSCILFSKFNTNAAIDDMYIDSISLKCPISANNKEVKLTLCISKPSIYISSMSIANVIVA